MEKTVKRSRRTSARRAVLSASAAALAAGLVATGFALDPASAAAASTTLTVNAGQVLRPVTHVATGSLYGLANATQPSGRVSE